MAKDEVKARLAPVPVFTVANPKNEFVLVAGEVRACGLACLQSSGTHTLELQPCRGLGLPLRVFPRPREVANACLVGPGELVLL